MKILLTNDDGIFARGLSVLRQALEPIAEEIYVIAPDRERSAVGHAITMHRPLRVRETSFDNPVSKGWVVDGTPADCVKLGLESLVPREPDIVVAGINLGPNLGTDVLYSGTVASALEGVINGVPAIAVSLATHQDQDFTCAAAYTRQLLPVVLQRGISRGTLLNINVPPGVPKGSMLTKLGSLVYINAIDRRTDPRGREYFWMAGKPMSVHSDPGTDIAAVRDGYISITPINVDMTDYKSLEALKDWLFPDAALLNG
ncbi:5'/3'-nucleotidase SurE [Desulforudis sp. 1088]|uniref:5'/3'-nucleotidase SurE n=1 Tax=unclassified Candidatus Desulforudis TaxID=2635950 RepID=UPI0034819036